MASPVEPCAVEMNIGWLLAESGVGSGYRPINGILSEVLALSALVMAENSEGGVELSWSISAKRLNFPDWRPFVTRCCSAALVGGRNQ